MTLAADFPVSVSQRPEVARVQILPARTTRNFRIVHLCNWHLIPQKHFEAVLSADGLPADEIKAQFLKHVERVQQIQAEQQTLMAFLVPELHLRSVHLEGLCVDDAERFEHRLQQLRAAGIIGNSRMPSDSAASTLQQERLLAGTAGQLYMDGVLKVLPVEDKAVYEAASPFQSQDPGHEDLILGERRESAMVRQMIHDGAETFVILGGLHDLSDNVPDDCEYVRIETRRYAELMSR
ncbi:MAG: hypothetical protein ACK58L_10070 [Planctomycetota bacterium]